MDLRIPGLWVWERTGDYGSWADVMRWSSVPTSCSLHPPHPLEYLLLTPSVLLWILENQDIKTPSSFWDMLQREVFCLDISSGLLLPLRLLFISVIEQLWAAAENNPPKTWSLYPEALIYLEYETVHASE